MALFLLIPKGDRSVIKGVKKLENKRKDAIWLGGSLFSLVATLIGIGLYWVMLESTKTLDDLVLIPHYSPYFILSLSLIIALLVMCTVHTRRWRRFFTITLLIINIIFLSYVFFMFAVLGKSGS